MRVDCFDLETTNLKATFGHILCGCFLPMDPASAELVIFRLDDKAYRNRRDLADDSKMAIAIRDYMEKSFAWVGWYSKMFDVGFLQTRLLKCGADPLERRMHIDLIYYARRPNLALHSSRLDAVAKTFKLSEQKTELNPDIWNAAFQLDREAMDYVVEHCTQDVRVLKEVFDILSPFIRNIHY